jgi:hypothetical protein
LIWATEGGKEGERREGAASTRNIVVEGKGKNAGWSSNHMANARDLEGERDRKGGGGEESADERPVFLVPPVSR